MQQAGQCIAFNTPTAARFHIIRATEAVIRAYCGIVIGKLFKPKMRNWGAYIKVLESNGADKRITGFLDHIRECHRNPVFHPEETLSFDEAQVLLGIAVTSMIQMTTEIERLMDEKASEQLDNLIPATYGQDVPSEEDPKVAL